MLLGDALKLLISGFDRVEEVVVFWREETQGLLSRSAVKMAVWQFATSLSQAEPGRARDGHVSMNCCKTAIVVPRGGQEIGRAHV